ncbi:hypothetical protein [Botrimarina hoheduenensis]|uniref:Uncharacterized protein n=1 Tax=Botrimarina hoheduenensis TaxID=2528000 RepID=A0A5C5VX42_9BACT|nr:hypothetical protein [Botrimarina hoheduenensis]TWT42970.1 hypothetical protein Pla111_26080 [Botrimarina hoheduenensis]
MSCVNHAVLMPSTARTARVAPGTVWPRLIAVWLLLFGQALPAIADVGLLFDEDFTDGALDDIGAWPGAWSLHGQAGFRPTNSRPATPLALSSRVNLSAGAWTDRADWSIFSGSQRFDIPVHKQHEVVVVKFTAFSDIARSSRLHYGVEVAMLDETSHPDFQGAPHFGHDLSFEAMQAFSSSPTVQSQLEGNVENLGANNLATTYSHYDGGTNDAALDNLYENLVIWRNRPGQGSTNIEQWGVSRQGDYDVGSEMNSMLNPTSEYATFNKVQMTLFRNRNTTGEIVRNETTGSNAQIGLTHAQVGVTRRTDFNLDYTTGMSDYFMLAAGWGSGSKTMLTGDANNDGNTDEADFLLLTDDWAIGSEQPVTRYTYDTAARESSSELLLEVNTTTGMIRLLGSETLVTGYEIVSEGGLVAEGASQIWNAQSGGLPLHTNTTHRLSDLDLSGTTIGQTRLGLVYDISKDLQDLKFTWQGALGEATRTGSVTYIQGLPGDFNGDGSVDLADYTVWRDGAAPTNSAYLSWAANFGALANGGSYAMSTPLTSVPEPGCWLISVLVVAALSSTNSRITSA